jgi:hypothetical protein
MKKKNLLMAGSTATTKTNSKISWKLISSKAGNWGVVGLHFFVLLKLF